MNKRMLICIACGNGSIEYRIELSKTRRQKSSSNLYFFLLGYISVRNEI
ncbi:Hypothetical protein EUBREC_0086 [Agathobacter rectalis ATCC 33656]|uniref:Uncharacterized protein n=1 Tax=Agathobacter rectalis (strain ATCC 33656 / DSM 3377 / JCM 17463 / KCTC 5835 / VPI 0990) TaxID=515619 RepID=C4Z9P3_AGARV|nr:Hypothetical protein EUBREC_0086 [Agathobacter rectalis ATCC 33656]